MAVDNYQNPSLIRILLKTSKTDPFCKGTNILLGRTRDNVCPVAALLQWLVQRGNGPGPLFVFVSGAPLTRPQLVSNLRSFVTQMGGYASGLSGHSFRSGAATTAVQLSIPDSQIKLLGRWKSNAFQQYVKPSLTHLAKLSYSLSSGTLNASGPPAHPAMQLRNDNGLTYSTTSRVQPRRES